MRRALTAAAVGAALSVGGIALAARGGSSTPPATVPDNPADDDPKSPGFIRANTPRVQPSPEDDYACGYKFKDLPAFGYHPPDYVDDEGVGPPVIADHDGGDDKGCRLMTRAQVEHQRQYVRENGEAPSGQVVD